MSREIVNTPDAPGSAAYGSFPYSQAVKAAGLVFVAGQGPFDPATGKIVGETIQDQTRQALKNCEAILRAAGKLDGQGRQRELHPPRPGGLRRDERGVGPLVPQRAASATGREASARG